MQLPASVALGTALAVVLSGCAAPSDGTQEPAPTASASGQGTFVAAADMRITVAENSDHSGQARHYGGWIKAQQVDEPHLVFEYHHCAPNSVKVNAGDTVAVGTPLCTEGDTGNAKRGAHHLHFQML